MSLGVEHAKTTVPAGSTFWVDLWRTLKTAAGKLHVQRKPRALRIQETLTLGDRRFLAIVQFDDQKLLVGVTPRNITLLKVPSHDDERSTTARLKWEQERSA